MDRVCEVQRKELIAEVLGSHDNDRCLDVRCFFAQEKRKCKNGIRNEPKPCRSQNKIKQNQIAACLTENIQNCAKHVDNE